MFFSQKKKARDFKVDGAVITAVNHNYHSWLMTSFAWRTILGIKFMIWLKMIRSSLWDPLVSGTTVAGIEH